MDLNEMILICLLTVLLGTAYIAEGYTTSNSANIQNGILSSYSTTSRPSSLTTITFTYDLYAINYLDTASNSMSTTGIITLSWSDTRLQWTASSFGNIDEIYLPLTSIWTPTVVLEQSEKPANPLGYGDAEEDFVLSIASSGTVTWELPVTAVTHCLVDATYFPWDKQTCTITFGVWPYSSTYVNFSLGSSSVGTSSYQSNGDWKLDSSSVSDTYRTSSAGKTIHQVVVTLKLSRLSSFGILGMLLPVLFLNVLGLFVFCLPVEEKMTFAMLHFLALVVLMSTLSDFIPTGSFNISVFSIYLFIVFLVTMLEIAVSICIVQTYRNEVKKKPVSSGLQAFTWGFLSKCICSKPERPQCNQGIEEGDFDKNKDATKEPTKLSGRDSAWTEDNSSSMSLRRADYSWTVIAEILDRFFFLAFLLITFIYTSICILVMRLGDS